MPGMKYCVNLAELQKENVLCVSGLFCLPSPSLFQVFYIEQKKVFLDSCSKRELWYTLTCFIQLLKFTSYLKLLALAYVIEVFLHI